MKAISEGGHERKVQVNFRIPLQLRGSLAAMAKRRHASSAQVLASLIEAAAAPREEGPDSLAPSLLGGLLATQLRSWAMEIEAGGRGPVTSQELRELLLRVRV